MKTKNQIRGKRSKISGQKFERLVRKDLEENGWIVSKWMNQVDIKLGKLIPAKQGIFRLTSTGFPDFLAYEKLNGKSSIVGYEVKSRGYLDKEEKEKCSWLLKNKIFSEIWIASKDKKQRGKIIYKEFEKETKK